MRIDDYIDNFIEGEKQIRPNPFLSTRVVAEIEKRQQAKAEKTPRWQAVMVAISIAAISLLGITIGNAYVDSVSQEITMNINDNEIEKLDYYLFENNE
ncbi:hypothetical protein [Anaerorudis cellulosivorans]|uniref:hypothetical protein n=1 Tax=Anaerorudis cellulosivorans TaxID=3397862 RepID=UPI0022201A45|nr:hypothetical protein [Seramator thermalis]MCW1736116.1 hypothetical protein [Seramator thermalis]